MGAAAAIIPLLATAIGTGVSIYGDEQANSRMNSDVSNELAQQQAFSAKEKDVVDSNLAKSTEPAAQSQINTGAENQLAQYHALQALPLESAPSPTSPNAVTNAEGKAQTENLNQAAAKLAGYGSWENAQSIGNQNAANTLGVLNTESGNAAMPLQYQLGQDQQNNLIPIGSLISSAGGLAGTYGATSPILKALQQAAQSQKAIGAAMESGTPSEMPSLNTADYSGATAGIS